MNQPYHSTVRASDDDQIDQDLQVSFSIIPTNIGGREIPKNERQEIVVTNFHRRWEKDHGWQINN
jgi:hypothetical protein